MTGGVPLHRRFREPAGLAGSLVLLLLGVSAQGGSEVEYKVKAGFLYNFARFVEWPSGKLGSSDQPIVIGTYADEDFVSVLERVVAGKTVGNRRIVVRRISGSEEVRACHLLLIGNAKRDSAGAMLARAREAGVLSVGESDGFISRGGVINFYLEGENVRFEISQRAAARAGLKLSARLLSVAKVID